MIPHLSERALILAPRGRDAQVAAACWRRRRSRSVICPSLGELVEELKWGAGFALVTEEALRTADLHPLADWLERQPEWSDFPFILLTQRGGGLERNPAAMRLLQTLGNVTFLERPFHPTTLVSLAQSALRGRRRQYEARARLEALAQLNETLEARVDAGRCRAEDARRHRRVHRLAGAGRRPRFPVPRRSIGRAPRSSSAFSACAPRSGIPCRSCCTTSPMTGRSRCRLWSRALAGEEFTEIAAGWACRNASVRFYEMKFNSLFDREGRPSAPTSSSTT